MLRNVANHDQIFLPLFTSAEYAGLYAQREAKPTDILILDTWEDILAFAEHPPLPDSSTADITDIAIDRIDRKLGGCLFERQSFIDQIKQALAKQNTNQSTNQGMNGSGG